MRVSEGQVERDDPYLPSNMQSSSCSLTSRWVRSKERERARQLAGSSWHSFTVAQQTRLLYFMTLTVGPYKRPVQVTVCQIC